MASKLIALFPNPYRPILKPRRNETARAISNWANLRERGPPPPAPSGGYWQDSSLQRE